MNTFTTTLAACAVAAAAASPATAENWVLFDGPHWDVTYNTAIGPNPNCVLMSVTGYGGGSFMVSTDGMTWELFFAPESVRSPGKPFSMDVEFDFPGVQLWDMTMHHSGDTKSATLSMAVSRGRDAYNFVDHMARASSMRMYHRVSGKQIGHWSLAGSRRAVGAFFTCMDNL